MDFIKWISVLLLTVTSITDVSSKKYERKKKEWKVSTCECGAASVSNVEKIGASFEKYPWVVNLMDKKNNFTTFCVGTIISKSMILTSASCLLESGGRSEEDDCIHYNRVHKSCFKPRSDIAVGFPFIAETFGIFSKAGATVKKIIPYSHSTEDSMEADLVLLRMSATFDCEHIPPVCLGGHKLVKVWRTGIISGWKTEFLKNESFSMMESDVPVTVIRSRNCTKIQGHRVSKQAIMCPLKNESASYCKGYAGAPVAVQVKHRFHLVGVMSKAIIDDDCEKHEIYPVICIQHYLSWIHRQIKKEKNIHFDGRILNRSH